MASGSTPLVIFKLETGEKINMAEDKTILDNKTVEPQKIDRLGAHEDWTFKDDNGYEWKYTFQFPGLVKAYEMLDNATMANGQTAKSVLFNEYLQNVVVSERLTSIDDLIDRPGVAELFNAIDSFLGNLLDAI